ncbi:ATP-binding protein [Streptomyces sp. DSM 118148]|uniref:ATP-binding protein n=1 Tax=Streptomyces sp. DSM 118148 TaxID=3448667 RepID=UPI004040216B
MISHSSRHCTVELQALPSRIGQVRRIVSAQLRYWHMDPLIDRAALGVTELLSNVHRHARPDKSCTVELELLAGRLTVSVRDHDPRLPVVPDDAGAPELVPLATCGRGLAMVAAMSESWGARPEGDDGKVVWFTLPAPSAALRQPARSPRPAAERQPVPRLAEARPVQVAATPVTTAPRPVTASPTPVAATPAPAVARASAAATAPARSAVPG